MKKFRNEAFQDFIKKEVRFFETIARACDFDTQCDSVISLHSGYGKPLTVTYNDGHGMLCTAGTHQDEACKRFLPDLENFQNLKYLSTEPDGRNRLFTRSWPRSLEVVEIHKNCGDKIAPNLRELNALPNLHSLLLMMRGVRLHELEALTEQLEVLGFGNASDMERIQSFRKLHTLNFGTHEGSLDAIGTLDGLKILCIETLNFHTLDGLEGCKSLERIRLQGGCLTDISAVASLEHLKALSLLTPMVEDISPLAGKDLELLTLTGISALDFSPLAQITGLHELILNGTYFEDTSVLAEMKTLRELTLADTLITDLSPLCGLENLEQLNLENCKGIHDLSPLYGLKKLKTLYLSHDLQKMINEDPNAPARFRQSKKNDMW